MVKPLCSSELKFRNILKEHISSLLRMQNHYWKQRFTQRVMQFGDENTKFFHSMATERYRKNVISQLVDGSGRVVQDHGELSSILWQEFKRRLGSSVGVSMQFDLQDLVQSHPNLEALCLPFSNKEIDEIILELPSDKAPGPMGSTICSSRNPGISLEVTCTSSVMTSFIIRLILRVSTTPL
jgi:hypothetical protein